MPFAAPSFLLVVSLTVAACSSHPEPTASVGQAIAIDRPLDTAALSARSAAARTAALVEAALVQVTVTDLRRCLAEFQAEADPAGRPASRRHRGWLIVAAAQPADGSVFQLRRAVAPELNPVPGDGWQDRLTYRTLLRSPDPADGSVACLSCVFDYDGGTIFFRHAYALGTCPSTVPGERELAVSLPVG